MDNQALQATLINALNKLKSVELDKAFAGNQHPQQSAPLAEQYFAFGIADKSFLIKANCSCEVFVNIPVAALPNSPELLLGLCNIRSTLVPVYQLHTLTKRELPQKKIVLAIGKGDQSIALLVDSLPASIELSQAHLVSDLSNKLESDDLHSSEQKSSAQATELQEIQSLITQNYMHQKKLYHLLDGALLAGQLVNLSASDQVSYNAASS